MIHSLSETCFAKYGRIESMSIVQKSATQIRNFTEEENVALFRCETDTVWDYDSGMTALLILDGDQEILFYFDRAVTIYQGVVFGFYPMGNESSVRCGAGVKFGVEPMKSIAKPKGKSALKPIRIFTRFLQHGRDGFYFRGERHGPNELCYVEKGALSVYCEGQKTLLSAGEIVLFGKNVWHMQYSDKEVRFLTVSFQWEGRDLDALAGQVFSVTSEMERSLAALKQNKEGEDGEEFYEAHLKLLLLALMEMPLCREGKKRALPASKAQHRAIINQAMQTVSDRVYENLTVPMLASAVNVSPSQLSALFQNYLGISPAKYITRLRLEEGKILLSTEGLCVGEVAKRLNYSSIQHFSRQFHDHFGMTPSQFAKTNS